jgi:hypothetical protein
MPIPATFPIPDGLPVLPYLQHKVTLDGLVLEDYVNFLSARVDIV